MIIRQGTKADIPAIERMARSFLEATSYGRLFKATPESLRELVVMMFNFGDRAAIHLAVDESGPFGMLAVVAAPHPISGEIYADEVCWWVDPSHRGGVAAGPRLLRSAEDWARARDCKMVKMVAPSDSAVGMFYERLGYRAVETAFVKVF